LHISDDTLEITADSPCIGHCTTVLGDDVCRSCLRTFEEVSRWLEMSEEERRAVNRRIALLANKVTGSQGNS
jgi:predicted Fe-S protein YdhL (DUF1289 family)